MALHTPRSGTPERRPQAVARVLVFTGGVAAWVIALMCVWLMVGPAYWLLYNLRLGSDVGKGHVAVFGIWVDQVWWIYFPVLISVALVCLVVGARHMRDAIRRVSESTPRD